jgi:hypothetical protein
MPSKSLSKGKGKNKAHHREIRDIPEHEWVPSINAYNKLIFHSQPVADVSDHGTSSLAASQSRRTSSSPSKSTRDRSGSMAVSGSPTKKQRFLSPDRQILISDMDHLTVEESSMEPVANMTIIPKSSKRSTLVCLNIHLYIFTGYSD